MMTSLSQRSCRSVATPLCASSLRVVRRRASSLPPSSGTWGTLGSAESRQTQTAHTRGKECGTGTHAQQTEIMQSLPLRTRSPPMYDICIHLSTCVHTCMRMQAHACHSHQYISPGPKGECFWFFQNVPSFSPDSRGTHRCSNVPTDTANHQHMYIHVSMYRNYKYIPPWRLCSRHVRMG